MFFDLFQNLTQTLGRPLILGHRGAPHLAPENSLASFRKAFDLGADGIELDVQQSSDGILLAYHDEQLPSGEDVAELKYSELILKVRKEGQECPRVAEIFHLAAGRGLLNIEIKSAGFEAALVKLAREMLPADSFAFSSFDARAVMNCRKFAPDVPAFLIVFGPRNGERDLALLESLDGSGIAFQTEHFTAELARTCLEKRIPTFSWTVNEVREAKRLAEMKVQGIITDIPGELLQAFSK